MEGSRIFFQGANALIFGGAKGIGLAVAQDWAARGASVAIADIDVAAAHEAAAAITERGGHALGLFADVLSDEAMAAAYASAEQQLGNLDILMNNAGALLSGNPEDIPMAEWQRMMDINYFSVVRGVQLAIPKMLARRHGHIVITASFAGYYPYAAGRIPYAASKAATISMSENLALYLEPRGVRVSCLVPGAVMTNILDSMTSWSEDCTLRGPGSTTRRLQPEDAARILSDGMADGKILIPTDPAGALLFRQWATDPDAFIRARIDEVARGDNGLPG